MKIKDGKMLFFILSVIIFIGSLILFIYDLVNKDFDAITLLIMLVGLDGIGNFIEKKN